MTRHHIIMNAVHDIASDGYCFSVRDFLAKVAGITGLSLNETERVVAWKAYRRRLLEIS